MGVGGGGMGTIRCGRKGLGVRGRCILPFSPMTPSYIFLYFIRPALSPLLSSVSLFSILLFLHHSEPLFLKQSLSHSIIYPSILDRQRMNNYQVCFLSLSLSHSSATLFSITLSSISLKPLCSIFITLPRHQKYVSMGIYLCRLRPTSQHT